MSNSQEILVLQVSAEELRLAATRLSHDRVEILDIAIFPCAGKANEIEVLRDQITLDAIRSHVRDRGWIRRQIVCLVGGSFAACQHYDMPPLAGEALIQAATLKFGQQLHFDVGAAIIAVDSAESTIDQKKIRANVTAIHKDLADAAIDAVQSIGLHLIALSAAPNAISRLAASMRTGMQGFQAVLCIDEGVSTLVVLEGSTPFVTTELSLGIGDFTKALRRPIIAGENVIQLDEAAAITLRDQIGIPAPDQEIVSLQVTGDRLLPLLEPILQKFAKQLTQWLSFASTCNGGVAIRSLIVVGPGARINGIAQALACRLSIEVESEQWLDNVLDASSADPGQLDSSAFAVAATKYWQQLPDLIPAPLKRQRRIARIRRAITICGPILAAAILALAVLFDGISKDMQPRLASERRQLENFQQVLGENTKWANYRGRAKALTSQLEAFTSSTPSWTGVFKELSLIMPSELKAIEFVSRPGDNGTVFVMKAGVYTDERGRSFDEIVSQTVLLLQRSAFFHRVQLTANRGKQQDDAKAAGVISIEMDVISPGLKAKA